MSGLAFRAGFRLGQRMWRRRTVRHVLGRPKVGKVPKLKSYRLTGLNKVMPRMFRRGYGLGVFRKRRRNRRRIGYRRKTQNKVHSFVRWCDKDTTYSNKGLSQITEQGVDQNLVYTFTLDNVVNPGDFTNLYDMYRINKVTLYMERLRNSTGDGSANPYNYRIAVVHDYNDANNLSQEDDYMEYANCKRYQVVGNGAIKITLYPKIANKVENVTGTDALTAVPSNKVWLNIANDEVPHFGLKIWIPAGVTTEGYGLFRVRAKYHLSMKNSK